MSAVQRVLVVGGGIGGLSTAIALRRAQIEVEIIEKNPAWDVSGVGIIQPGNALRALDAIGLAEEVCSQGHPIYGDATWLADGQTKLAENDWPPLVPGLPPGNGITRPRLHHILQTATLASGADVRTGVTITSILHEDPGQLAVEFTDGEHRTYDLVVGADGLYSQVRELAFGVEIAPNYTGQVVWRYNLPRLDGLEKIWIYLGMSGTAGFVPLAPDLMYILMIEKPPPGAQIKLPGEGLASIFRERLAPYGGLVAEHRELITDDEAVVYRPVENVVVPAPWYMGRVVLIGDAAHATSPHCGQGAAQAIEDGLVLTAELSRREKVEDALSAFMTRRFERCRFIVEGSEKIGRWEQDQPLPIDPNQVRQQVVMAAMAPL
jgi:2-polyprenyl-6-methoxyphenol hydroxylase-like FAD-dependent oxidoreductase